MASPETASKQQQVEIDELRSAFPDKVKVISNIGEFTSVVSIRPAEFDLQVKFQLRADYPDSAPVISIRSSTLTSDQQATLTQVISDAWSPVPERPTLTALVSACSAWLQEIDIDATAESSQEQKTKSGNKHKGKKSKKGKEKHVDPPHVDKLPPMKTALDVIKRLQWDEGVDRACFIVGYLDRLVGLVERAFNDFTWEDLASVDHFALAIPQHRIQYFKYKQEKVWDKNERLDNVFGSTGGKLKIVEAVERYEARVREAIAVYDAEDAGNEIGAGDDAEHVQNEGGVVGDSGACGCDNTERTAGGNAGRTEVVKVEGTVADQHQEGAKVRKTGVTDEGTSVDLQHEGTSVDPPQEGMMLGAMSLTKDAPDPRFERQGKRNYFVAFEITDRGILDKLTWAMSDLERTYPQYKPHRNPINSMHLTLAALTLNNVTDLQNCVQAMNKIKPELTELAKRGGSIVFKGLGCFNTKVVFAKVHCPHEFREMSKLVIDTLIQAGVKTERKAMNPHLTIFHVGRSDEWEEFSLDLKQYEKVGFGKQDIDNVQVCQMGTCPPEDTAEWPKSFYTSIFDLKMDNTWR